MDDYLWWRDGIIYQIYPRSFQDSNNDGLGDLPGIISRLDYLADLGIDAIWLSPIYPSPDRDFGYDVSDYLGIDPRFGNMQDFDTLLKEAHKRNIHIILDLVLNHTSDQHPWFKQSRSSKENPFRNWYIWHPGKGSGKKPNNWQSVFGGDGWELDSTTNEYYFHMFVKEQPDLNWHNPEVRNAILNVFKFWLDKGVDGFRLDVFNAYFKDRQLTNNPPKFGIRGFDRQEHIFDIDQPEMMPLLPEIRGLMDKYPDRYIIGETFLSTPQKAVQYTGEHRLHAAFNFTILEKPWEAGQISQAITMWDDLNQQDLWPNQVLNNHDQRRSTTRYKFDSEDKLSRTAAAMILSLRGTPFLYYGEEIGMRDIILSRSEILDPPGKKFWPFYKGRDGCRSPMQWDDSPYSGFSKSKTWLPVHPDYVNRNVAAQLNDPDSLLNFYRLLIKVRRSIPALQHGSFKWVSGFPEQTLAYIRQAGETKILILLNFKLKPLHCTLPVGINIDHCRILVDSSPGQDFYFPETKTLIMQAGQALILDISAS